MREQAVISGLSERRRKGFAGKCSKTSLVVTVNFFCHCDPDTFLTEFYCFISGHWPMYISSIECIFPNCCN